METKHCPYCSGTGYRRYTSDRGGRCRPCGGKRTKPLPQRQIYEKPKRILTVAEGRERAMNAMKVTAELFKLIDTGAFQRDGKKMEDVYHLLGLQLGGAVVDTVFNRAVARARARIPAQYHPDFERGLKDGIATMAKHYENVVWEGR